LLTAIYQQSGPIRVPVHVHEKLRAHERKGDQPKRGEHPKRNGTPYSGISTRKRQDLLQLKELMKEPLPLEAQTMQEGLDLMEVTRDETQPSPEDRVVVQDLTEKLRAALSTLTQREEIILRLRYGIDSPESLTLEEVGRLFKLTKERIRQIESKALKRLSTTMAPAIGAAA
jgi:RNA polymerase primary sigma factor